MQRATSGASLCSADRRRISRRPGLKRSLTEREAQIAELVADGLSNKAIASRLSIEPATVKNHVHSVLGKLEVSSRGEAAAKLRLLGIAGRPI
jgi:DNA-binding NarL/FixJ family response regulator